MTKRFEFKLKVNFIDEETGEEIYHKVLIDNSNGNEIGFDDMVGLLNEQQAIIEAKDSLLSILSKENEQLRQSVEYWQKKYEKGTETFTFPPNCDECDFLGNNGICGYCKFTLKCYDSKENLEDGKVLPNCPLKPLINKNVQLKETNEQLRAINKDLGDDLHNCRLNKNIISEKLKLWQDTLAEYDIYTITELGESFELDAKINKEKDEKIKELEVKVLNLELKNEGFG